MLNTKRLYLVLSDAKKALVSAMTIVDNEELAKVDLDTALHYISILGVRVENAMHKIDFALEELGE